MADVKKIKVDNEEYIIKDETARNFLISDNNKNFQFAYSAEKEKYGFKVDGEFHPFENPYLRFNEDTGYIQALNIEGEWVDIYETDELPISGIPVGEFTNFSYNGTVQTWTAPATALYLLEVWGGSTSYSTVTGYGGYSKGYKKILKGTTLYVCCGGGSFGGTTAGYNGGGSGGSNGATTSSGGGGATHIALRNGTLSSIGSANLNEILIVAGGAGGSMHNTYTGTKAAGGSGGGTSGGAGAPKSGVYVGQGGTQTSGNAFGQGANSYMVYNNIYSGAGGGGLYGGTHATTGTNDAASGGGGSGYIGGVPSLLYKGTTYNPATTVGGNNSASHGKAKITCIA